ncbi:MAG: threonine synthase, partial [Fusobacteriaceae bacterium]
YKSSEVIKTGISIDGGLFVKQDIQKINLSVIKNKTFKQIAKVIIATFLDDYKNDELEKFIEQAYNKKFSAEEITFLKKIDNNTYVLELFHGPTSAFKDIALSILPYLLKSAIEKSKEKSKILILTATSGDTGKAALEAFKNISQIQVIVFYPKYGVSKIQEKQMLSQEGENVFVVGINGNFDDAQSAVKSVFNDKNLKEKLKSKNIEISSANSINIGRLIPQIVYYFYSYIKLIESGEVKFGEEINFSVPTGNFGNILAGYYAKQMGLPINKLICASNENNVLYNFLKTGVYDRNRELKKTNTPSMDILISSNLERVLYHLSEEDSEYINDLMDLLDKTGKYEILESLKIKMDNIFTPSYSDDKTTLEVIKRVYDKFSYILDPHTAVAFKGAEDFAKLNSREKVIVLSTASPYKFSRDVYKAIFGEIEEDDFRVMELLNEKTGVEIPKNLKDLKERKIIHNVVIEKEDIKRYIEEMML